METVQKNLPRVAVVLPVGATKLTDERLALYFSSLINAGASPFALPSTQNREVLTFMLEQSDGLLISGGIDIEPGAYGAEPDGNGVYDVEYDRHCFLVLEIALKLRMPILGICRGEQLINVACGGTLVQDIPGHRDTTHALQEVRGRVARAMGTDGVVVNSFHHQVVDQVAPGFEVVARSPEGYVEAIEHRELPYLLGVQWHPERLADSGTQVLYRDFVAQCAQS